MVPGILIIILFAAFNLDEFEGELGAVALVIVSVLTFDLPNVKLSLPKKRYIRSTYLPSISTEKICVGRGCTQMIKFTWKCFVDNFFFKLESN